MEALNFPVDLHSYYLLSPMIMTKRTRSWICVAEITFPCRAGRKAFPYGSGLEPGRDLDQSCCLSISKGASQSGSGICFGSLLDTSLRRCSAPKTHWSDNISWLAWEQLGIPGRAKGSVQGEGSLGFSQSQTAAPVTWPPIRREKMDG